MLKEITTSCSCVLMEIVVIMQFYKLLILDWRWEMNVSSISKRRRKIICLGRMGVILFFFSVFYFKPYLLCCNIFLVLLLETKALLLLFESARDWIIVLQSRTSSFIFTSKGLFGFTEILGLNFKVHTLLAIFMDYTGANI